MGMIQISVNGSFGRQESRCFSAMEHGHAHAVNEAIEYLVKLQKEAINNDQQCHDDNEKPQKWFQKPKDK